jgi:RsiW-degrading membrane proteinase PrsW (M82 family)
MTMMLLALLPAAFLLYFVYKADTREKEPPALLLKLFMFGVVSTLSAMVLELLGDYILSIFFYPEDMIYIAIENFLIVALAEELGKYHVVKRLTWNHPAFNYTFDAVVYAVFASLGFAAFENVLYLTDATVTTAVMRGVLAVPGHAIDAVFMGYYFGVAKKCDAVGNEKGKKKYLRMALWIPVVMHGFYDFCLSSELPYAMIAFFIYEIVITIYAYKKVKKLSAEDTALFPEGYPGAFSVKQMHVQGIVRYNPMTGQPYIVDPSTMNFDPITGEPLHGQPLPAQTPVE